MVSVEPMTGVYAVLENRPGTLERAARAIGEKRINIDSLALDTQGGNGFLRVWTTRPRETVEALKQAGIEAFESQSIVASLQNRPGELGRVTREIAAAGINVEAVATTADGRLAFRTSDNELAAQILRKI